MLHFEPVAAISAVSACGVTLTPVACIFHSPFHLHAILPADNLTSRVLSPNGKRLTGTSCLFGMSRYDALPRVSIEVASS